MCVYFVVSYIICLMVYDCIKAQRLRRPQGSTLRTPKSGDCRCHFRSSALAGSSLLIFNGKCTLLFPFDIHSNTYQFISQGSILYFYQLHTRKVVYILPPIRNRLLSTCKLLLHSFQKRTIISKWQLYIFWWLFSIIRLYLFLLLIYIFCII